MKLLLNLTLFLAVSSTSHVLELEWFPNLNSKKNMYANGFISLTNYNKIQHYRPIFSLWALRMDLWMLKEGIIAFMSKKGWDWSFCFFVNWKGWVERWDLALCQIWKGYFHCPASMLAMLRYKDFPSLFSGPWIQSKYISNWNMHILVIWAPGRTSQHYSQQCLQTCCPSML